MVSHAEAQRRYSQSARGRATIAAYEASERGRAKRAASMRRRYAAWTPEQYAKKLRDNNRSRRAAAESRQLQKVEELRAQN